LMAFIKEAEYLGQLKFETLNTPDWKEYKLNIIKIASVQKGTDNLGGFNIESAIKENPDHLFVKIFAIKKDEVNDNGDAFSETELKKATHTFVGVPVFCNHQNDDIEKARGKCVHSWYDDEQGGIYIISMIDRVAYPKLARGIEEGYIQGSSMGCSVEYSCCSICHNRAAVADEYCDHVKNRKNKKFSGTIECQYHKSPGSPMDKCPVCGKEKNNSKEFELKEAKIFEHNFNIKFIEDSFVVNPACHDCLVEEIFNVSELTKKVANLKELVVKLGSGCKTGTCSIKTGEIIKESGMIEIEYLTEAMDKIEKVAKSMMAQKAHVSLEYVSDLVDALASVQSIADELIEMGYAQLPSTISDAGKAGLSTSAPVPQPISSLPPVKTTPSPSGISTEEVGDIGSVTKPKTSNSDEKKKDLVKVFRNLNERLAILSNKIKQYSDNYDKTNIKESTIMANKNSSEQVVNEKIASHDTTVILEKQLDNAKFTGERTDDAPTVTTEKQLDKPKDVNKTTSETPQDRLGSPDIITEKQLDSIKSGYVVRWGDFPEVITEKQWTDISRTVGSVLSEDRSQIITEKQLADFMSKHSYEVFDIITEKQLDKAKTEITERWADSKEIVKTAMESIADAIAFYKKTPQEIEKAVNYISQSAKNFEKAACMTLINALPRKFDSRKAEQQRYTYFSKMSSVETPHTVDALLVSIGDRLEKFNADDILAALKVIVSSEKGMKQVEELVKARIESGPVIEKEIDKVAQFSSAIDELDRPEDGTYQVFADLKEIEADPKDKKAFLKGVIKVAETNINDNKVKVALTNVDIDKDSGSVIVTLKDVNSLSTDEKKAVAQFNDWMATDDDLTGDDNLQPTEEEIFGGEGGVFDDEDTLPDLLGDQEENYFSIKGGKPGLVASRKENREKLVKEAQMFGGEMGGQAGASQGPGAGATLPTPPAAAAPAPLESFEQSDLGADLGAKDDAGLEAKPPGSICPVCGSEDVDIIKGAGKCNNCSSEMAFEVNVKVTKWSGLIGEDEAKMEGEESAGAGFELPPAAPPAPPAGGAPAGGPAAPTAPIAPTAKSEPEMIKVAVFAITTRITPSVIKKIAESKIKTGFISPLTGGKNTIALGGNKYLCLDTGVPYSVEYAVDTKTPKNIYAQWKWDPNTNVECESCSRSKQMFVEALKKLDITEEQFDAFDPKEKGKTIIAMKEKGLLKQTKTASTKDGSLIGNLKKVMASVEGKNFPSEMCRQKLANRFGMNAVALSGPCEGKPLYECVCNSLKKAGIYSNGLAIKIAEVWSDKDASSECIEDYVRLGFELKQASTICASMKAKYAQIDDMVADEVGMSAEVAPEMDAPEEENIVDVDPFAGGDDVAGENGEVGVGGVGGGNISISLPLEVVEQIDKAVDVAMGENTGAEEHHQVEVPDVDVELEVPGDAAQAVDEVADKVLDENLGDPSGSVEDKEVTPDAPVGEAPITDVAPEPTPAPVLPTGNETKPIAYEIKPITQEQTSNLPPALVENIKAKEESEGKTVEAPVTEKKEESTTGEPVVEKTEAPVAEKKENPFEKKPETEEKLEEKEGIETKKVEKEEDEEKPELADEGEQYKEGEPKMASKSSLEDISNEVDSMKTGYIGRTGRISLDLTKVVEAMQKKAEKNINPNVNVKSDRDIGNAKEKSVQQENAQDSSDIGKIKDGKTMGKEPKFDAQKPSVPTGSALIGKEQDIKAVTPKVPAGSSPMGDEQLEGGDARATGGDQGQGSSKAASSKDRISALAERIQSAMRKNADEKKLAPKEPVSKDKDIQPISGDSKIGDEKEVKAIEVKDSDVQTSNDGFIGKEKDTFKDKPNSPKDHPSIPAGGGKFENETNVPEKQEKDKGTVIAKSEDGIKLESEAFRIAGRMLEKGRINVNQLASKVAELKNYKIAQLHDLEKAMFTSEKGLNTVADGVEHPVIIGEESNQRNAGTELREKLSSLFTLHKRNEKAQELDTEFNKVFK
jgi:hypothetical protein